MGLTHGFLDLPLECRSGVPARQASLTGQKKKKMLIPGPSRGVQWRSLSGVGASIGDPFEGAGVYY